MKKKAKLNEGVWASFWAWFFVIFGAVGTWACLVELATHDNPIFDDISSHDPKWVAAEAVVAICFLLSGLLWLERLHKRNNDE